MDELSQKQIDHILVSLLFSRLATSEFIDAMLVALVSEREESEIWALNGLRAFGEIRKKDTAETLKAKRKDVELLEKMIRFYFENYEKANKRE
jgi:hypothetical protein